MDTCCMRVPSLYSLDAGAWRSHSPLVAVHNLCGHIESINLSVDTVWVVCCPHILQFPGTLSIHIKFSSKYKSWSLTMKNTLILFDKNNKNPLSTLMASKYEWDIRKRNRKWKLTQLIKSNQTNENYENLNLGCLPRSKSTILEPPVIAVHSLYFRV